MHDVLQEVDGDVITIREVCLNIHCEELIDLPLGSELGAEGGGGDRWPILVSSLHACGVFNLRL